MHKRLCINAKAYLQRSRASTMELFVKLVKVRTQCFSEKFPKKHFFDIFSPFERSFQRVFSCFEILVGSV